LYHRFGGHGLFDGNRMKAQRTDELIELAIKRRISETNGHNNKKKTSLWQKQ